MLTLLIGIALYLRVYLPYDHVFSGGWIKFTSVDAYYHMRLVDNLLNHFPQHITFDPYTFYPHGHTVGWPPFFDWLLAGIIWLVSLGSPSQHTIDVVGVYFPAVLGTLSLIPVYFIGKVLFNRWVGVLSAGLVTLLPSEFLSRSILGFTDHHVAETLFTTITILFLILAVKTWQVETAMISKTTTQFIGMCNASHLLDFYHSLSYNPDKERRQAASAFSTSYMGFRWPPVQIRPPRP